MKTMNRPIKFRAWNGGEMISPDFVNREGDAYWQENSITQISKELMQFTGLLDKQGREIYEGDIVISHDFKIHWRVQWHLCRWQLFPWDKIHYGPDKEELWGVPEIYNSSSLEIIGNIYENPELLPPQP
jgi:hypothetical protein